MVGHAETDMMIEISLFFFHILEYIQVDVLYMTYTMSAD